jgi:hypothetical protein
MLPDPHREAAVIRLAFHECRLGLLHLKEANVDDDTRERIRSLQALMDTNAEHLSSSQKSVVSTLVNDLANFFDRKFHDLTA